MAERITGHTELIGLMAYPIRHSSSPAMHNEAFATLGLDYAYLAFEVDNSTLEDAIKGLRALKMVGSNVSMPNKTVVGQYLDELSPAAEMCGAVNTIVNDNGKLIGHITDGIGFMQALKDNDIDVIGKKMTICGAGGAATAIEIQAALDGVKEISIFNGLRNLCKLLIRNQNFALFSSVHKHLYQSFFLGYKDESLNQIFVDFYKSFLSFRKSTIWKSTNRTI